MVLMKKEVSPGHTRVFVMQNVFEVRLDDFRVHLVSPSGHVATLSFPDASTAEVVFHYLIKRLQEPSASSNGRVINLDDLGHHYGHFRV